MSTKTGTNKCIVLSALIWTVAAAGGVRADSAMQTAPAAEPEMPVRGLCAHRGDAAAFPENTVPPIAAAARKGAAKFGGDLARRDEIETVLRKSFLAVPNASNQFWVVAGDYNSISPVDGRMYDVPSDSPRYAVHRWLAENTPLVDVMHKWLPYDFHVTGGSKSRLDYVYLTRGLYGHVTEARVVVDRYTRPTYSGVSDIWHPSDHRPILVDFNF